MTPEEAMEWFKNDLKDGKCSDDCPQCNASEMTIKALEKQIPRRPVKANRIVKEDGLYFWADECI